MDLVAKCLSMERSDRALRILDMIDTSVLTPDVAFSCLALRANCLLASRSFAALEALMETLSGIVINDEQRREVSLLDAHRRALAGRPLEAVRVVTRARRETKLENETKARALRIVGIACYRAGHYSWSQQSFQTAASYYRLHGREVELAQCLNSLSLVARSEGKSLLALNYLDEAMRRLRLRGCKKIRIRLLINRGVCLLKLGKLAEARTMFMGARSLATAHADVVYQVMIHNNLGHIYRLQGDCPNARDFYEQALGLSRREKSVRQIALSLEFLGEASAEAGEPVAALEYLNEAHALAQRLAPQGDVMMEVLRRRGEVFAAMGDVGAAAEDLQRAMRLCGSRGEKREAVLARRAYCLYVDRGLEGLETGMQGVLDDLLQLDDRFEYARTVYLILKDGRLDPTLPWLSDATVAATHYFTVLGSKVWKQRLYEVMGPRRRMTTTKGGTDPLQGYYLASRSPAFAATLDAVRVAGRSTLPALIAGETGVGKEVIAQLLHQSSSRAAAPLTAINCGALPENLVESELFGYAQGAYTGAGKEKPGLFEASDKGTVLLDEVGDLPALAQVKLLRFLDTGEVRRVGEIRTRRCDVRVLASTNRDLDLLVREGRFRADLLFRLKAFRIEVPALRERPEDILDLARCFLRAAAHGGPVQVLSAEIEGWMFGYGWPGNIRELRNLCGYLQASAWGRDLIQLSDLPPEHRSTSPLGEERALSPFDRDLLAFERGRLVKALSESKGSISGAARLLGMSRNTVSQRMRRLGLRRQSFEL